ncbi:MAG TPA: histidine kinase [Gemmatimonadaceae bacterium]|nr:histidine kinase [Gemmatimonadaceae bacterium]
MLEQRDEQLSRGIFRLRPGEILGIVLFWAFLAALTATGRLLDPRIPELRPDISAALISLAFIEYSVWAAVTFPLVGLVNRMSVSQMPRPLRGVLLILLGLAVAVAVSLLLFIARGRLLPRPPGVAVGPGGRFSWYAVIFRGEFVGDLIVYCAVLGAAFARNYFLQSQTRLAETRRLQAETAQLHARLAESQLSALRAQLNPHFLFNTLNAISSLVEHDPRGVRRMIARLSELLRHTLDASTDQEIPLARELDLLERYLDIMRIRFADRLDVTIDAPNEVRATLVPNLILQPLVENAIQHGVAQVDGTGRIAVRAERRGDDVVLTVRDNGPGPAGATRDGGVGLRNTVARLEQLYGARQRFSLQPAKEGGAIAEVTLPFHVASAP